MKNVKNDQGATSHVSEYGLWGRLLPILQTVFVLTVIACSLISLVGPIISFVISVLGYTIGIPAVLTGWPLQAFILIILGFIGFGNAKAMSSYESFAYSSTLQMNLLSAAVLITIGPLGWTLAPVSVLLVVPMFHKNLKPLWYAEFREDMGPRMKELRYSLHLVRKSPLVVVGILIILVFVGIAVLAPFIAPYGPEERVWTDPKAPPGAVSNSPKFSQRYVERINNTAPLYLPNETYIQFTVTPEEVRLLEELPNVYMSLSVRGTNETYYAQIYAAVYDVGRAQLLSMTPEQRALHRIAEKYDTNTLRTTVTLKDDSRDYTWHYWLNVSHPAMPWNLTGALVLRYNHYYPIHIWGADENGGDIFSRIVWAAQVDLRLSVTIVVVAVVIGAMIGAVAGYYGGKIDELMMRVTDIFFAFPGLILAMAIVMALGQRNLENISLALMVTWWPVYARLVRGQVLTEREKLYVEAARSVGASDMRILLVHILPNTFQPLIVQATLDTGGVLLTAAGLSFIGFGAQAGVAEWGLMISTGQLYLTEAPWMSLYPGLAILMTALSFNLVGDGIRDIFDPKLRRR
ncbi:MAG: ABC transporter permease [Candidatus Thorarchaeota archaeon]|nr:ABC transporter permease [Candidatus Thorarchaeota archaeon]